MAILGENAQRFRRWGGDCRRIGTVAGLLVACLLLAGRAGAADGAEEYEVKAAFLHRFVSYIEWPEGIFEGKDRFVVGVVGQSPFNGVLEAVFKDKELEGLPVEVRESVHPADASECHLLFVASCVDEAACKELAEDLAELPVLTVGDEADLAEAGLLIAFELVDNRVRFVINADAVARSPLRISSRLMQVARIVRPGGASR